MRRFFWILHSPQQYFWIFHSPQPKYELTHSESIMSYHIMIVNRIFKAAHGRAAEMGATINSPSNETESGLVFGFAPLIHQNNLQKPALHITARGFTNLRGGHDACASAFSKRSERRAGCRRPSDEQSEERSVNPLLYAVRVFAFSPKA